MTAAKPKALVVDDDQGLRTMSRIVLELDGFEVREAGSISEAEAAVAGWRPDVVLLDVHLGHEQSEELFTKLRQDGIPVAAVTGTADIEDVLLWGDATLAKPFEPADLVALAKRLANVPDL